MKTIAFFILVLALAAKADEYADKKDAAKLIGVANWEWHKGGFDTIMMADFVITNSSPWPVKDLTITCHHSANSGTQIDENTRTIYEIFPAHSTRLISNFNMGFISSQAQSSSAHLENFEFVPPHLSREEIAKLESDAAALRATNAALAKMKAAATKKAAADKALAANQAAADKGDAYGLLRMGQRYRDGDGVDKDAAKAKDYLQRAATAGSPTAADELKKLAN